METRNFIKDGKMERVAVHVYNNKLSVEDQKTYIKRVYSTLSEDKFDARSMDAGYTFLLRQIMQHGLDKVVINEIIDSIKTQADYTELVTKPHYLQDFFYAYVNLHSVEPEVMDSIHELQQQGIIPEIPILQGEEQFLYAKRCKKQVKQAVKIIGIVLFE